MKKTKPTLQELRALAEKVDHGQYCGCSSMGPEPLSPGMIDCYLGALMKAFREFCDHRYEPVDHFDDLEKCRCGKVQVRDIGDNPET